MFKRSLSKYTIFICILLKYCGDVKPSQSRHKFDIKFRHNPTICVFVDCWQLLWMQALSWINQNLRIYQTFADLLFVKMLSGIGYKMFTLQHLSVVFKSVFFAKLSKYCLLGPCPTINVYRKLKVRLNRKK